MEDFLFNMDRGVFRGLSMPLSESELQELARARHLLEHPGIAARIAGIAGKPSSARWPRCRTGCRR